MEAISLEGAVARRGPYTLFRGKIGEGDARTHFVTGPTITGRVAPIASFYNEGDGRRWLRAQPLEEQAVA